jgi:hypothetical protein
LTIKFFGCSANSGIIAFVFQKPETRSPTHSERTRSDARAFGNVTRTDRGSRLVEDDRQLTFENLSGCGAVLLTVDITLEETGLKPSFRCEVQRSVLPKLDDPVARDGRRDCLEHPGRIPGSITVAMEKLKADSPQAPIDQDRKDNELLSNVKTGMVVDWLSVTGGSRP